MQTTRVSILCSIPMTFYHCAPSREVHTSVRQWMSHKCLKMNDSKTEVLLISSKHLARKIECPSIIIGDHQVEPSDMAKSIGVIMDKHASMEDHITSVCRSAQYHLYNIGRIRKYLTREATEQLIHAFITSKLDYCNALFCGLPVKQIKRLQRLQNIAARIVTLTRTLIILPQYCMNFIGCQYHSGLGSKSFFLCSSARTTWHLHTCKI
ncbi:hypothetical protein BSL78_10997 [Apostichopus japonicus]|uniref:RNA-directed DNA polymerase from mobile element jockey-like n=1 Tax=Stichopus japonicus TaxID=307972 RepID=A0A2G8KVV5_STIJA|nr:hypothetical protein BSL78_10997 [Apostichopus japonicus]